MSALSRKNNLGRNLQKMAKQFPEDYRFFPRTFILPADYNDFKAKYFGKDKQPMTFIVKPEANC